MKKILLPVILILCFFPVGLFAQDNVEEGTQNSAESKVEETFNEAYSPLFLYGLGLSEANLSNIVLWGFNRYIAQSDYGIISVDSMRTNLTNPWVWDQDEFAVNHMGHPYQGSLYYSAGRSSGNGFWASASITALGSIAWELLMETETPSKNDFIVTTVGGISFGEMLFRLSDVVLHGEDGNLKNPGALRWVGATLMSPATSINHGLLPGRPPEVDRVKGFSSIGMGYSSANISLLPRPQVIADTRGFSVTYVLDLDYGSPFQKMGESRPYDWFSMNTSAGLNLNSELFLTLFSKGHLLGWTVYGPGENARNQLGLYLHYDFVFNRIINLGANSIGPGWIRVSELGDNWTMDTRFFLNFVLMGASDLIFLKYKDLVEEPPEYERRDYSLSTGLNFKAGFHFSRQEKLFLDLTYRMYNLYIIDDSVPESGSGGRELVGIVDLRAKHMLGERWFAGINGVMYHKESFYHDLVDLDELLWKTGVFTGVSF